MQSLLTCSAVTGVKYEYSDVDECQSNPCIHGTCLDQINGYSCDCEAGYKDENCSTSTNKCLCETN